VGCCFKQLIIQDVWRSEAGTAITISWSLPVWDSEQKGEVDENVRGETVRASPCQHKGR
jgi:hypothetical protein